MTADSTPVLKWSKKAREGLFRKRAVLVLLRNEARHQDISAVKTLDGMSSGLQDYVDQDICAVVTLATISSGLQDYGTRVA